MCNKLAYVYDRCRLTRQMAQKLLAFWPLSSKLCQGQYTSRECLYKTFLDVGQMQVFGIFNKEDKDLLITWKSYARMLLTYFSGMPRVPPEKGSQKPRRPRIVFINLVCVIKMLTNVYKW